MAVIGIDYLKSRYAAGQALEQSWGLLNAAFPGRLCKKSQQTAIVPTKIERLRRVNYLPSS